VNERTLYLGLDVGTSGVKAVLLGDSGEVRFEAGEGYDVSHPRLSWSEQSPGMWWQACVAAMRSLADQGARLEAVAAIGVAGQMHGAVLLDAEGEVIRPAILWNDGRSVAECDELERRVPDLRRRSGNLCMPGFTAPKLLWLARNEPDAMARVATVMLPKDYIVFRLTGARVTEMSDASGTVWLDPARRDWDDTLVEACGLGREQLPTLHEGSDVVGRVTAEASERLALPRVPVVAGAGDNAAGAVGAGVVDAGQGFLSLGTSGVVFVASDAHRPLPERTVHAFCHCLPGRWHQMAVTLSAAESLRWFAGVVGREVGDLIDLVERRGALESDLLFLPYLAGERTPHNDAGAVGIFHGLRANSRVEDMALAVMEGVAFSFCDGLDALNAAGAAAKRLSVLGGGARSRFWRQLCADALGVPLEYRESGAVGPAFGAARLARIATMPEEVDTAIREVCTTPAVLDTHQPDPGRHDYLTRKLERYRRLYRLTRELHTG